MTLAQLYPFVLCESWKFASVTQSHKRVGFITVKVYIFYIIEVPEIIEMNEMRRENGKNEIDEEKKKQN